MGAIGAFLSLLFILPTIVIAMLIGYVLKKSFSKQTPESLLTEKTKMEEKVKQLSKELREVDAFDVTRITNNISQTWIKSLTRKSSGHALTLGNEPIIAFQRIERGWGGNARILASSSSFTIYYELKDRVLQVFYNSYYLGKLDALHNIADANGRIIGKANRFTLSNEKNKPEAYAVFMGNSHIADIAVCFDMRTIRKHPLHRVSGRANERTNPTYIQYDAPPLYQLVNLKTAPDDEAMKWVTALATFESVYYTLDFV